MIDAMTMVSDNINTMDQLQKTSGVMSGITGTGKVSKNSKVCRVSHAKAGVLKSKIIQKTQLFSQSQRSD